MCRRFLLGGAFAISIVLIAAGCGGSGGTGGSGAGGDGLVVGSNIPFPPFEQGKPGHYTGFDIELMEAIAGKIGRKAEFQNSSFETIFRDLGQDKFEAVIAATTITEEREKAVDFSNPYYLSEQAVIVQQGSEIEGIEDLSGKTVGAQQGGAGLMLAKERANAGELRPYPDADDAINALKAGVIEAVVDDAPAAEKAIEEVSGLEIAELVPTEEKYGIAVAKGNTKLLEEINRGLGEVEEDGTYSAIFRKWFHRDPPKAFLVATPKAGKRHAQAR